MGASVGLGATAVAEGASAIVAASNTSRVNAGAPPPTVLATPSKATPFEAMPCEAMPCEAAALAMSMSTSTSLAAGDGGHEGGGAVSGRNVSPLAGGSASGGRLDGGGTSAACGDALGGGGVAEQHCTAQRKQTSKSQGPQLKCREPEATMKRQHVPSHLSALSLDAVTWSRWPLGQYRGAACAVAASSAASASAAVLGCATGAGGGAAACCEASGAALAAGIAMSSVEPQCEQEVVTLGAVCDTGRLRDSWVLHCAHLKRKVRAGALDGPSAGCFAGDAAFLGGGASRAAPAGRLPAPCAARPHVCATCLPRHASHPRSALCSR